jgi:predicted naringenin-chalcone synthase
MTFLIRGIGTAVPAHTMSQDEATELAHQVICRSEQERRLLSVLYRKAGVENRHTALPHRIALQWLAQSEEERAEGVGSSTRGPSTSERMQFFAEQAPPLAISAATQALTESRLDPAAITHLITVSCTGFNAPGIDKALISGLPLRPTAERIQVGFMGCHGAINGLRVAEAITTAKPHSNVLLCAVELCSLHYRFQWDPERIVANALFGDGAAAVVANGSAPLTPEDWTLRATGSCLIPASEDAMSWNIGDYGFEMTLHARVPDLIQQHLRNWLTEWLSMQGTCLENIRSWAIHPGGPKILQAAENSLELQPQSTAVSREVLARHGNMSSPTVLFILKRLRELNAPRPCVALGFGPGMFAEAALFI